jgi:hypothetical protein
MDARAFNRTPCAAIKHARQLATVNMGGQIASTDGAHEIAYSQQAPATTS